MEDANESNYWSVLIRLNYGWGSRSMAYLNWGCDDVEYACEDCIEKYERDRVRLHRKHLPDGYNERIQLLGCPCEEVKVICCNCSDVCDHWIASYPKGHPLCKEK